MDSVVIAFSHLPTDDCGNKPCDEKNPNIITFSTLPSFDRANTPSNEKILYWSNSDRLHFHTCTPAINSARNQCNEKQARKSSEDAQAAGYAQFEKVGLGNL